jgi:hypothetical protein
MIDSMLIVGTVWYVYRRWWRKQPGQHLTDLELLGLRYASGEIGRHEYWQMRDDIMGYGIMRRLSQAARARVGASLDFAFADRAISHRQRDQLSDGYRPRSRAD